MQDIESLILRISGREAATGNISIACVSSTHPVYLAFLDQSDAPCFVIRPANSKSGQVTHELSCRLHRVTNALVPETIGLFEHNDSVYSVQRGAEGRPWFNLPRSLATKEPWGELRTSAIDALQQFHEGVASVPEWRAQIHLGDTLRTAYKAFCKTGAELAYPLNTFTDSMSNELDKLGVWDGIFQHGDFGLSNLLFGENRISVIDLEDFGITAMPLYDEFTLALSLNTLAPTSVKSTLASELSACIQPMKAQFSFNQKTVQALFLLHLLLRLGKWSCGEKRQPLRLKLLHLLEQYANNPDAYIGT
ncbi:aminoglycoside phosphotransferase family protein [Marinobacter salsuginis]|uniref:aminoglycoside phosphotransferase family protein n=1 Tax=Marinobacter salsuginis TaxID=418719 RepID=UPI0010A9DD52|nr:aminoglycoside phosphotransferase family protein [Marinobacter salsuginis]